MGSFTQGPVGSPVQNCPTCQEGWDRVTNEVKKIDGMKDVQVRNRAISSSYARLYESNTDLKWAGAAAFASKQVGCGMNNFGAGISGAKSTLGAGNLAVYDELYPPLRFYQQNKGTMSNEQIMACMDQKPGEPLDPSVKQGLRETMDGHPEQGATTMLKHEQQDTLQQAVYDSTLFNRTVDLDKMTGYRLAPMQYVVSSGCTSTDANRIVDFSKYKGDLYNFSDRWPFAKDCASKFIQLSEDPRTSASVQQELGKIANAWPP